MQVCSGMHRMLSKNLNIHQRYVHMHALRADSRTQAFEQTTMRRTANTSSMYALGTAKPR